MKRLTLLCVAMLATATTSGQADEQTPLSAQQVRPLLIGTKIPDAPLKTYEGETQNLHSAIKGKPAVIVFYRGGW